MTYFITGVTKGIGLDLLKKILAESNQVIGLARNEPDSKEWSELVAKENFTFRKADICDYSAMNHLFEELKRDKIEINCFILNAAVYLPQELREETLKINLNANLNLLKLINQHYNNAKNQVIFISSLFASIVDKSNPAYSKSKLEMENRILTLREDTSILNKFKIVTLGPVKTTINSLQKHPSRHAITSKHAANQILEASNTLGFRFYDTWKTKLIVQVNRILPNGLMSKVLEIIRP